MLSQWKHEALGLSDNKQENHNKETEVLGVCSAEPVM